MSEDAPAVPTGVPTVRNEAAGPPVRPPTYDPDDEPLERLFHEGASAGQHGGDALRGAGAGLAPRPGVPPPREPERHRGIGQRVRTARYPTRR